MMRTRAVLAVLKAESIKLSARAYAPGVLAVCALAPFLFVWAMRVQSSLPEDTLFGRAVRETGLATPLVVLGFAALWAFPVLASSIAGDLFSAEDRDRTWPALMTRSCGRAEVFAGKVIAAAAFACLATLVLGASSIAAGIVAFGYGSLVDLSGALVSPAAALGRIALSWTTTLPPTIAFAAMAIFVSISTRSSAAGIGLPVVLGLAMQLALYIDAPQTARRLLLSSAYEAWHGLLTDQPYYGPLMDGMLVSAAYCAVCLTASFVILRRRDITS
jgi:ABC-2 type transport system permease protein